MMSTEALWIITKPELPSNKRLEEEFTSEIFHRVEKTRHSRNPKFIFFRPQGRPREEFDENIAPLLNKGEYTDDTIIVSISNNTEKSDAYLDDTGFTFKLKVKLVLSEGSLDIIRNEQAFRKVCDILTDDYQFKKFGEREKRKVENNDLRRRNVYEAVPEGIIPEIRFKSEKIHLCACLFGYEEKTYSVSKFAVEDEIQNISKRKYAFQRKYEKMFHLKPGTVLKVLKYVRDKLEHRSEDGTIIEGCIFEDLIGEVNNKFGLPQDRFRKLLKEIYTRNFKGKGKPRPPGRALLGQNVALLSQTVADIASGPIELTAYRDTDSILGNEQG